MLQWKAFCYCLLRILEILNIVRIYYKVTISATDYFQRNSVCHFQQHCWTSRNWISTIQLTLHSQIKLFSLQHKNPSATVRKSDNLWPKVICVKATPKIVVGYGTYHHFVMTRMLTKAGKNGRRQSWHALRISEFSRDQAGRCELSERISRCRVRLEITACLIFGISEMG